MRQAGYLAAACIYALDHNITRLAEDHKRAAAIGKTLEEMPYVKSMLPVETNIVIFEVKDSKKIAEQLKKKNILVQPFSKS